MGKPIYRLIDGKGRIYLPKQLRDLLDADCGDFVKMSQSGKEIHISKVHLIEVGDQTDEAKEAYISAALAVMPTAKRLEMLARLMEQLRQENTLLEGER